MGQMFEILDQYHQCSTRQKRSDGKHEQSQNPGNNAGPGAAQSSEAARSLCFLLFDDGTNMTISCL